MVKKIFFGLIALLLFVPTFQASLSHAEESTTNKMKDDLGDAKTNSKKIARKAKQKLRKATGTDTTLKDAKDKGNDIKDDATNEAEKVEHHSESNN